MSRVLVASIILSLLLVGACGGDPVGGPPDILYGEDICDRCRMVVSEPRHAAGAVVDGRPHRFDDPGCLLTFLDHKKGTGTIVSWVHDENEVWLRVEEAWFVEDPEGITPMGSGILAFGSAEVAAAAGERYGTEPQRWTAVAGRGAGFGS